MGGGISRTSGGTEALSSRMGRNGTEVLFPSVEGKMESTTLKSRSSHVKLFTTASPERRRPLGKFRRLEGLSPTSQAEEAIFDHKSGKVNQRSNRNRVNVRIDNSLPLEPQAQERELNPEPGSPQAAGPVDRGTARLRFPGIEPLQADTKYIDTCGRTNQTKGIITPNGGLITAPNGGTDLATISLMNLKSMPTTNQEQTQGRGTSPQPGPMTTTLEQDNQVAKLGVSTNERTPGPSAILLLFYPSTQFPWPCLSQCPDDPHGKF
ncbi:hypothetical protein DSO57_1023608 [Entomophthora muscae]|uniref:Uncharacterized protein n=1 Tax=Entomophthora muscae TaxID=34485 RepID=A0ACC2TDX0_9FUNG|nr:hypothetical protein DSO57_1023608 [Entomophthora muscae]